VIPARPIKDRYVLMEALLSAPGQPAACSGLRDNTSGEAAAACAPIRQWLELLRSELASKQRRIW